MRISLWLSSMIRRLLIEPRPAPPPAASRWPDILPLPPVVARCEAYSGLEHLRQHERAEQLIALYQDRLLSSRDPAADPDAVARRTAAGLRVKQRLAAQQARLRLRARIRRDASRVREQRSSGVVVALRVRP